MPVTSIHPKWALFMCHVDLAWHTQLIETVESSGPVLASRNREDMPAGKACRQGSKASAIAYMYAHSRAAAASDNIDTDWMELAGLFVGVLNTDMRLAAGFGVSEIKQKQPGVCRTSRRLAARFAKNGKR
jgi:hypothetical protein